MILLGVVALIVAAVAHVSILWTVGVILIAVGVILAVLAALGHAVGGRNHWY